LQDVARICKPGGYVIFDCFTEGKFDLETLGAWLQSPWDYPVVIPEKLLLEFCEKHRLVLQRRFDMDYSASLVSYFVFKKKG
jgi:hypothetical protein